MAVNVVGVLIKREFHRYSKQIFILMVSVKSDRGAAFGLLNAILKIPQTLERERFYSAW